MFPRNRCRFLDKQKVRALGFWGGHQQRNYTPGIKKKRDQAAGIGWRYSAIAVYYMEVAKPILLPRISSTRFKPLRENGNFGELSLKRKLDKSMGESTGAV
jgi:hypothetical protein